MIHPEWLNQNEHRAYPFREDAVLDDSTGTITVPNGLVLDFIMTLEASADFVLRLTTLTKASGFYAFTFSDADGVTVASVSVNASDHTYGQAHALTGVGDYEICRGRVVLGRLDSLDVDMPDGVYTFDDAALEACTVRPDLRAVRSIRATDGFGESAPLYGHVRLIEGRNIRLTQDDTTNAIQIDAITDESFTEQCDCETAVVGGTVRTINGVAVDNLKLEAGTGVEVTVSGDTIRIGSPGVTPCCSCVELAAVTSELNRLRDDSVGLASHALNIENLLRGIENRLDEV